jgi:bla regulator protein blaR1
MIETKMRHCARARLLFAAAIAAAAAPVLLVQAAALANPAAPKPPAAIAPQSGASSAALPAYEVSVVNPSKSDQGNSMLRFTPDGIRITNVPLHMLLREALGTEDDRIFGEPGWVKSDKFDIEAKVAPDDAPKLKDLKFEQRQQMLVPLLEERFGLKFHHETRDLPVYDLVIAKGGVKMTPSKPEDPQGQGRHTLMSSRKGKLEAQGIATSVLAHLLSAQLGRTVIDKTGLTGNYDYTLEWTPDDEAAAMARPADGGSTESGNNPSPAAPGPSLFTALQEQLGLKLEASKGPADVIVIDHIEQPTPN